ncbi:hypothetical protein IW261DRAFT_1414343 [Armillaria novae-zelandiae]|uniref:Uncharacterized protein n=1 Tax=Armillaria novae-zelandiae TaxID=153914 RepID=A0AA39PRL3_9AGAR|nr:hypothetical protein IW261DRAFT_1414343 [Armillaria novae-zelandiae]
MSAPETATKFAPTQSSSVRGGQIVGRPPLPSSSVLTSTSRWRSPSRPRSTATSPSPSLSERVDVVLECDEDVGRKTSVLMVEEGQANVQLFVCAVSHSSPYLTLKYYLSNEGITRSEVLTLGPPKKKKDAVPFNDGYTMKEDEEEKKEGEEDELKEEALGEEADTDNDENSSSSATPLVQRKRGMLT